MLIKFITDTGYRVEILDVSENRSRFYVQNCYFPWNKYWIDMERIAGIELNDVIRPLRIDIKVKGIDL